MPSAAVGDVFSIFAGGNLDWGPICCQFFDSQAEPTSSPVAMFDQFGAAEGSVRAGNGSIGGSLSGTFTGPALQSRRFNPVIAASHVGFLQFDGPTPMVTTQANYHITGTLTVRAEPQSPHPMDPALGLIAFEATINDVKSVLQAGAFDDFHDGRQAAITKNEFTGLDTATNASDLAISGTGNGRSFTVPTGIRVLADMRMELKFNHLTSGFAGTSTFSGNFGNTMSWATDGPVFDLPPGYTVNGMGIVDNHYVVPETINGFAVLFTAMGVLRYRRNGYKPAISACA
jgi:hypothetical protein